MSLSAGSFGGLGGYGSHVWINPKAQLVTILMIQNMVSEVQTRLRSGGDAGEAE